MSEEQIGAIVTPEHIRKGVPEKHKELYYKLKEISEKFPPSLIKDFVIGDENWNRGFRDGVRFSGGQVKGLNAQVQYVKGFIRACTELQTKFILEQRPFYDAELEKKQKKKK